MPEAPLPPDEPTRLRALRRTGLLDTDPDPDFDRLAQFAGNGATILFTLPG